MTYLLHNAVIVNENRQYQGSVLIENDKISQIFEGETPLPLPLPFSVIDARNKYLFPGVIDTHVHFREPGLTHKGDLYTESKAAVAGGVTSFMDMPNTVPQTTTLDLLEQKCALAAEKSLANYAFYLGATHDNISEIANADPAKICGVKLFMGSSTGNMLLNDEAVLEKLFAECDKLIALHSEDDHIIKNNLEVFSNLFDKIPFDHHPLIRSEKACFLATEKAIRMAKRHNTRLHILHLSTAKELSLLSDAPFAEKRITAEVCPQYLWFNDSQYNSFGARMKCNPSIKSIADQEALFHAVNSNKIDLIGSDHAPHLLSEKPDNYTQAVSGMPQVQHSLALMLEFYKKGKLSLEKIVEKMCHAPAELFRIEKRGFVREGYFADLVLVEKEKWTIGSDNILSKCNWSPYEGTNLNFRVTHTFVNGNLVYENGCFNEIKKGKRISFY